MSSIVLYYSETGNTQKVAQAIATGLGVKAENIEEINPLDLSRYDLICIGTPVQGGAPAKKVSAFIEQLPAMKGKNTAVFCTMHLFGNKSTIRRLEKSLEGKGLVFLGSFTAYGWSRLVANFGPRIFLRGRPNQQELAAAEAFGRELQAKMQLA